MNWLDFILAIPLAWAAYKGFAKGLIFEMASIVMLMLGVYFGLALSHTLAEWLSNKYQISFQLSVLIGFLIAFLAVILISHLLARLIDTLIAAIALGWLNKAGGVMFSIAKYMFIISILFSLLGYLHIDNYLITKESKDASYLYKPVKGFAPLVMPKLKQFDISSFKPTLDTIQIN